MNDKGYQYNSTQFLHSNKSLHKNHPSNNVPVV